MGTNRDQKRTTPAAGITQEAKLDGAGAIAQGDRAVAVGAGGVYVGEHSNVTFQTTKPRPPPPFQALPPAADHIQRAAELSTLKGLFLAGAGELLAATVGLHGFGGAGKTILARLFCADPAIRAACRDGILWVTLGRNAPDPRAQIADLVAALTGDASGCQTLQGARTQLQAALADRKILLVIDDIWKEADARDLLDASFACARLLTTRNTDTVPLDAQLIDIGLMQHDDALRLLEAGLPAGQKARLQAMAQQLGGWSVLLRLANRALRLRVERQRMPLSRALDLAEQDLARKGVVAFDAGERSFAVATTMDASLDLLKPDERSRYLELAIFPQDVPIPMESIAQLWQLTAGLKAHEASELVAARLEPLSLLDYEGDATMLRMHDVLRSYLLTVVADRAAMHARLADAWGDRPEMSNAYAWRWLAFHRAQAAIHSVQPQRHDAAARLIALVDDPAWQAAHDDAIADLPALRDSLSYAVTAAVADDAPLGSALIVQAADALMRFNRDHLRPDPIFDLARQGELDAARRRAALFSLEDHWRQLLLLSVAWLAPADRQPQARSLYDEVQAELATQTPLRDLLPWIRADLWSEPPPAFPPPELQEPAEAHLIEEILKRVGGGAYDRELIARSGLDIDAQNPDTPPPTRGLYRDRISGGAAADAGDGTTTTRYLADLDGPYLIAYAAGNFDLGTDALKRYLSVYTNYNYAEYRFSTLWRLLAFIVQLPKSEGVQWVQDSVTRLLSSALGGGSVEFEAGLAIAVKALRAQVGDMSARNELADQANQLMEDAMSIKPGRDREGSDVWGEHKRTMLANAQSLGWLLGDKGRAQQELDSALDLADSGFAGYQALACEAVAEAIHVCNEGDPKARLQIEQALEWAQRAAHNVQDPTFCARMTGRVNALRRYWWQPFDVEERARRLLDGSPLPEFAALHYVGHQYTGRRPDALQWAAWVAEDQTFDGLERIYQRPKADFLRLNGGVDRPLAIGEEIAVPDPGFAPHLAARLAAEVLAQAGFAPLLPERMQLLRSLVPVALRSPTALDAVLTRLVLAQGRRAPLPEMGEVTALEAALEMRPKSKSSEQSGELITTATPRPMPRVT